MVSTTLNNPQPKSSAKIGAGYILQEEISRGPMASVYRATPPENGQPVAIKVFHTQYHSDPRFAIRFRNHMRRLAELSHDNLVHILDYGVDQTRYYIIMEWVDGTDLGSYISEYGLLSPALTAYIARQICVALDVIHQQGLVHQGIKPQNILLTADGQVKVTDVGLSRLLSESGLSKTHVMLAGVGYISPEQARGKKLTPQSDIYSLGATIFEMLTGRLPFESNDAWSVVRMHAMDTAPSPQQFNQQVPDGLANIVTRALQKDPELRFSGAVELEAALSKLERDSDPASMQPQEADEQPDKIGYHALLKSLLEPESVRSLLASPWQIGGRTLPFWIWLTVLFILVALSAFAILYLLAGFL